ncbi:MAG: hypothetical protein GF311_11755 [Candidatus Lokiarchaeota archaeon]|nr:hypothetical protein [Candidatus Lokiarchaeota archaeon]
MKDENAHKENGIVNIILNLKPAKSLFIVSCTREKIWDFNEEIDSFIEAKSAYYGKEFKEFLKWYESLDFRKKGYHWIILSGKYGYIEPQHPICWYDINMANPDHYPISLKSLKNQSKQIRKWYIDGKYKKVRLDNFENLVCINCDVFYIERIKSSLGKKNYISIDRIEKIIGE